MAIAAAANQLFTIGVDINEKGGHETSALARNMGGQMVFIKADLTHDEDIIRVMGEASKLGQIKYLVNAAGFNCMDPNVSYVNQSCYTQNQRAFLLLSRHMISTMKTNLHGSGVIADVVQAHDSIRFVDKPEYMSSGLLDLAPSAVSEGNGNIRFFTVRIHQTSCMAEARITLPENPDKKDCEGHFRAKMTAEPVISPFEVVNMIIYGISRHSRYLACADFFHGKT